LSALIASRIALAEVPGDEAAVALRGALQEGSPRVRSNALEALAKRERTLHEDHGCERLCVELKNDPSHRVRGSAVRLMAWRGAEMGRSAGGSAVLTPSGEHSGVVSRSGLKVLEDLAAMMDDPRPMHRLAGAWATGRALTGVSGVGGRGGVLLRRDRRWPELCDRLVEVSLHDPDERVRARALAVRTRLENEVRDIAEMGAVDVAVEQPASDPDGRDLREVA
jgi:hypothetical protein